MNRKTVIITGASSGIGLALVKAYLLQGFNVVGNARSAEGLQAAATSLGNPANLLLVAGDIADPDTAERVISESMQHFGQIDTLINNAGIFTSKAFTQFSVEDWQNNINTNLAGFFHISQRAIDKMEQRGSGHLIQITTSIADQPINGVPSVLASLTKGGLNAATKSLAIEYASRNIRVNAVAPGIIKTPMHPEETHSTLAALHPVGRMGEIQDIVDAVLFLDKATFVTGEILYVDGGQAAGHW
ncbi:SDR family NAD(P)-dependent oxidoreductase [Neptunicella sp. SCSIO 80796]|uniref:SDR family NAD(P)-dependent oxidoreductase n=1 Tax=Neptunicella plasticusilytica TaxID=3117012 RepID=UPI003A4D66FA